MSASAAMLVFSKTFVTSGWRVAMLFSAVIVIPALVARYKLADTPLFEKLKQREQLARAPSLAVFQSHARSVILVAVVLAFMQMDGYVIGTYAISFMNFAGIPLATTATIFLLAKIFDISGVILSGPLADLLKRKSVAYAAIGATTLFSYPFALAILSRRILMVAILHFSATFFGLGLLHGLAPILTSENFPTKFRYSGAGISYSLSAVLGGMIAPSVLAGLIGKDVFHNWFYMPVIYAVYCAAAMLSLLLMQETRSISIEDLDLKAPPVSDLRAEKVVS
jgi:MFS family permease